MYKVSKEDRKLIGQHKWWKDSHGYMMTKIKGKKVLMHRLILNFPPHPVDHVNRNKLDNRRSNLRLASKLINALNHPIRKDNSSGYKGVSFFKATNKYRVQIGAYKLCLGYYSSIVDAAYVYDCFIKFIYGNYGVTNTQLKQEK